MSPVPKRGPGARTSVKCWEVEEELIVFGNTYQLGKVLGEGSYGKVRLAKDARGEVYAVKIVARKNAPPEFLNKFLPRELQVLTKVQHPYIVECKQIIDVGDKVCIFMEYVENGDLLDYIRSTGPLSDSESRKLFVQLVSAIEHCHSLNIAHRDLKCENILLDKDFNIKLTDFGFSRMCVDEKEKRVLSETYCGSAAYAAPEILQGYPYNPKMYDVWSLGVILYTMVCASMPYDDSNIRKMLKVQLEKKVGFPSRMKGKLCDEVKHLIHHMLTADITRRATIEQIQHDDWVLKEPIPNHDQSATSLTEEDAREDSEDEKMDQACGGVIGDEIPSCQVSSCKSNSLEMVAASASDDENMTQTSKEKEYRNIPKLLFQNPDSARTQRQGFVWKTPQQIQPGVSPANLSPTNAFQTVMMQQANMKKWRRPASPTPDNVVESECSISGVTAMETDAENS